MPEIDYVAEIWDAVQENLREQPDRLSWVQKELEFFEQKEVLPKFYNNGRVGKRGIAILGIVGLHMH
jgi:hypothetical protein